MEYNYTIIIPHYNIPKLLCRLLLTIPVRDDVQVIVVDDCSSIETQVKLLKIKAEFPQVEWFSTGSNGGGGKARNIGLKHAKGKYLIFADADDFFNPCFEDALNRYKAKSYDMVFFAANSLDTDTYQSCNRDCAITPLVNRFVKTSDESVIKHKFTAPWCRFIRRELIEANDIRFQEVSAYNDMWFCMLAEQHSKNIFADTLAIYCVTHRTDSTSSVSNPQKEVLKMDVVCHYYAYAKQKHIKVASLWSLIGPMLDELRRSEWRQYRKQAYDIWYEKGFRRRDLKKALFVYKLYMKILIPGYNVFKMLFQAH
ncbi:MAG TPA: glycosyltransferase [Muribaculaceae bacterium]|nr:glycosyltransferase [Muribaculaceae bacterium]